MQQICVLSYATDSFNPLVLPDGAKMSDAGQYKNAVKVYEEDLKNYPKNGWALKGLMNAYQKLGDKKKYIETKSVFETAWKFADIQISSSRIL